MASNILLLSATSLEHGRKTIGDYPIHFTGVGKISTALRTTELIKEYKPLLVINFGSCGNLKNHKIGELLSVGTVYNDIDARPFGDYGQTPFTPLKEIGLDAKSDIKCFTTDMFYDNGRGDYPRKYQEMVQECDVVDMELYAIAQVCKYYSKPLLSYKWVSDDGNPDKWEENSKLGFDKFEQYFRENFIK
jgi:adenosylhomocysteine nucleosidase